MCALRKTEANAICFGPIDHLLIIGGGSHLGGLVPKLKPLGFDVSIFTSPRHIDERVTPEGQTLRQLLEETRLPYFVTEEIDENETLLNQIKPTTLGLAMGPAWIFKRSLMDRLGGRFVNFHPIPLPRYRGGAHYSWRLLRQDHRWGCTIQLIEERLDAGEVIKAYQYTMPDSARIPADDFAVDKEEGLRFLEEFLREVQEGKVFPRSRLDETQSSYFPRLSTTDQGWIDWSWGANDLESFICAFDDPYPGASTFIQGERVRLKNCRASFKEGAHHPFLAGLIYRKSPEGLFVAVRDGSLVVSTVLDEEAQVTQGRLRLGSRFYTPLRHLEEAFAYQARYDAKGLKAHEAPMR